MKPFPRILGLFLSLTLAVPNSAFALREQPIAEKKPSVLAGLEEALRSDNPAGQLLQLASAALTPAPVSPASAPSVVRPEISVAAGMEEETIDALIGEVFGPTGEWAFSLKGDRLLGELRFHEGPYHLNLKWSGKQRKEGQLEAHLELRFEKTNGKKLTPKEQERMSKYSFRLLPPGLPPATEFHQLAVQPPFKVPESSREYHTDWATEYEKIPAYTDPGGFYMAYDFQWLLDAERATRSQIDLILQVRPLSPVIPADYALVQRPRAALPDPDAEQPPHWKALRGHLAPFKPGEVVWTKELLGRFPDFSDEAAVGKVLEWNGWGKGRRWDDINPNKGTRFYKKFDPNLAAQGEPSTAGAGEDPSVAEIFQGLFKDGDPARMADADVAARLQTGDRKTIKVELEKIDVNLAAAQVSLGRLFVQEGAVVPLALRGLDRIGISDDPASAAQQFDEHNATAADLAFLAPAALERSSEWNAVLQGRLAGIIVTREALATLEQLVLRDPAYLAAFVAGAQQGTGLITILSIEVDEQTPGQRRLYLYA